MHRESDPRAKRRRRGAAVAVAIVAAIALIAAFASHDDGESPPVAAPSALPVHAPSLVSSTVASDQPVLARSAERPAVSAALRREYREAPDLYAYAQQARRRPAEGGLFYAMQAWNHCATVQPQYGLEAADRPAAEVAATGTASARRIETMERYQRRCGGFRNDDNTIYRALADEAKQRGDPLWTTKLDALAASKSGDRDAYVAAIQRMLDLHDPLLVAANVNLLTALGRFGNDAMRALWFEGHDYQVADESAVYTPALHLAACMPDAPCYEDTEVLLTCATGAYCASDPADLLFNGPNARPWPPGYENRVRTLADRMRAAIERGDVAAFQAPR